MTTREDMIGVPTTVNHFPVIAAVLNEPRNPNMVDGYVVCRQVGGPQDEGGYCTWHVWWYTDGTNQEWSAENGRYDLTYIEALADFAERAGMRLAGD